MFPDHFQASSSRQKQAGFLMPVAIFVIIAMGAFAATLSRNTTQTTIASVQEGVSVQAFFAAESAAQAGMSELFYSAPTRATADAACIALNVDVDPIITFDVPGLDNCAASLSCGLSNNPDNTTSYYRLISVGQCGGGEVQSTRTVEVSSFIQDAE